MVVDISMLSKKLLFIFLMSMVTFRFDDGLLSQYNLARPILDKYNYSAVEYVFTDPPEEGNWEGYMNWSQIELLHNLYGWEIGSHTKSHPDLTTLSDSELIIELSESKAILESHGFEINSFVSPFGLYNNHVLGQIAKYYQNHGSAWPYDFNAFPYNDYQISVQEVRNSTSLATIKNWIDQADSGNKWLVLLFHGIVESNPSEYQYSKDNFESVVDYVNFKDIPVVTVEQALQLPNENLITNNWASDLVITGSPETYSIYTPYFIDIDSDQSYLFKIYFDCQDFISGGVDVFFDEYDSQENWLDWKWGTGIWTEYVGYKAVTYSPGENTEKLLIWIEGAAGSDLTCYIDNLVFTSTSQETMQKTIKTFLSVPN